MQTLVLDRKNIALTARGERLQIHEEGQKPRQIPMRLLDRIVISASMDINSMLLRKLAGRGISLLVINPRKPEDPAWISGPAHNDAERRVRQLRASDDDRICRKVAAYLVGQKLQGHRSLLLRAIDRHPVHRSQLHRAERQISRAWLRLGERDQSLDSLRGIEGAAAAAWFTACAALLPGEWNFHGRNRRPPRDPVNAMLSLGYTLADHVANRKLQEQGWDPMIGFYHRLAWSRRSLSSDLLEPLRPLVDEWVLELVTEGHLQPGHFRDSGEGCFLAKEGRAIYYREWALCMLERLTAPLERHLQHIGEIVHGDSVTSKDRLSAR